ncbi:hypothetical protein HFN89_05145 [Rhizobium laguerreae]|nr:hypothetical protein [Rhizobium laguerreae]
MTSVTSDPNAQAQGAPIWLPFFVIGFFLAAGLMAHSLDKPTPMDALRAEREQSRLARLAGFKATDDHDVLFAGCYLTPDGRAGRVFGYSSQRLKTHCP